MLNAITKTMYWNIEVVKITVFSGQDIFSPLGSGTNGIYLKKEKEAEEYMYQKYSNDF